MGKDNFELINIEEIVEGNPIFQSNGVSILKVTQNGVTKKLSIPIKSTGITEALANFRKKKPVPPIIQKVVKPDDPAFAELGLTKKTHVRTYDLTDPTYLEEMENFNSEVGLKIVLMGLNIAIKNKDGKLVEDSDEKVKILKSMGLSDSHFAQIVNDITRLTKWEEEKEIDFLEE